MEAEGKAQVAARGSAQVIRLSEHARIDANGDARIVDKPAGVDAFCRHYGIEIRGGAAILYKAAGEDLRSLYDGTTQYAVGETLHDRCDPVSSRLCSHGLHAATLDWAVRFGLKSGKPFRLLEVAVSLDGMVVPEASDGKVRAAALTVLRELPGAEWGFYADWDPCSEMEG